MTDAAGRPPTSAEALVQAALAQVRTLPPAAALALHGQPGVLFVDLREADELARHGHIPQALHVPRGVLEFAVDPSSPWHRAPLGQDGLQLLLYCGIGWRSALAAQQLQQMGVPGVAHLGGGFQAWLAAGGPVVRGGGPPPPA